MVTCQSLCAFLMLALAFGAYQLRDRLDRLYTVTTLFSPMFIARNFRSVDLLGFPVRTVSTQGAPVAHFETGEACELPETFPCNSSEGTQLLNTAKWLKEHYTTGLVVLAIDAKSAPEGGTAALEGGTCSASSCSPSKAALLHESYNLGNNASSQCVSWSMLKSFISTMFGIAVDEGLIKDLSDPVTAYVPELLGSGYEGVPLKHVLQMSSGVAFDEDYFNPFSDINRMSYIIALGGSLDNFVASLRRERVSGEFNHYMSMDTQVLGMVISRAANQSLSNFLETRVWSRVGFESDALWNLDNEQTQTEIAFGVLGATTRDYARFGWMLLNGGVSPASGERLLSEAWLHDMTTPDAPHLMPGTPAELSDHPFSGYGYQWWIPPDASDPTGKRPSRDFLAMGVYGQQLYISRELGMVVVKNGADHEYGKRVSPSSKEFVKSRESEEANQINEMLPVRGFEPGEIEEVQGYYALRAIAAHCAKNRRPS